MNSATKDSALRFVKNGSGLLLLLFLAASAVTARAQSINNDLAPKKTAKKSTGPARVVRKPVRPRPKPIARRPANPVVTQPISAATPPSPPQTPAQIIDRYMDFQQSSGVTLRDWESVVSQTGAALQSNPGDAAVKAQNFIAQGQLAFGRSDYSNALIHFNAAAQVLPESGLPFYSLGKVYLATKQPVEAQEQFEKAIKQNKNFALAYKGWGDALTAQGKTKKAQEYYKQAAKIGLAASGGGGGTAAKTGGPVTNPGGSQGDSPKGNGAAPQVSPETPYDAELKSARQLTARKKWQGSLDKLNALSRTNPTTEVYIAIGDNYYGMRQWLSAQQAYRKAAEMSPNSALAVYKTGLAMFQMNEFQSAYEAFEKSLILDQNGTTINRQTARKMADQAKQKADDQRKGGGKGRKLLLF